MATTQLAHKIQTGEAIIRLANLHDIQMTDLHLISLPLGLGEVDPTGYTVDQFTLLQKEVEGLSYYGLLPAYIETLKKSEGL